MIPNECMYGKFLDEGITLQEKIDKNVQFAVQMGMSEHKARKMASEVLPKLKRWKKGKYKIGLIEYIEKGKKLFPEDIK